MIELYVEFEQQSGMGTVGDEVNVDELEDIYWEEDNNDIEEEFEANYEVDDENDDGDLAGNPAGQNEANAIVSQHPFSVPSFMRTLDLEAMHALEFPEYVNMGEGNVAAEDGEFSVGMEFGSRDLVMSAIKSYTISRGVDYTVYESELQTFYAKCKGYGARHIRSNFLRRFKAPYLNNLVVNIGISTRCYGSIHSKFVASAYDEMVCSISYSRTELEYNKNYQWLKERESFRRAGNIVVNWFDRRNEMFETLRRAIKGRPKSTRYLNEMDSRDICGPCRCTICGREGHSRSRCPQHASPCSPEGD
ncbi:hypothetical protein Ahy_A06g026673 [Arachis hypogaea]|uniref:CCHC-type domain-containing protein n=1 Tax=Arachis hypogaea TaxID=3818 RepID=A0A445CLC6_ARAHY|nr:hypothetical protein Ahy_A06g026673 [Arachis hypogaea]